MINAGSRGLYLTGGFALGYLLLATHPLQAQGDCKVILEAANKTITTASHTYSTMNIGGKDQNVEAIYLPGVMYSRVNGQWTSVKMTAQDMEDMRKPAARQDTATCKYVKDELVGSEMAAVYSSHEVTSKGTLDSQTWISKAKGLPIRMEMDIGGARGKSHVSSRYEYGDVKPPI